MAIKTTVDTRGIVSETGANTLFVQAAGGHAATPAFVTTSSALSGENFAVLVSSSINVTLSLPSSPENGQEYQLFSMNATVSLTGSNTAHKINNLSSAVQVIAGVGSSIVFFVGTPANMWYTK